MSISVDVIDNPKRNINRNIKIREPSDIVKIREIKSIRNAMREHLFFIGLDTANNVKNITLLVIGTSNSVTIDTKEIIRTALFSASEKVILVHNHPTNSLNPSNADKHISNVTNKLLKVFNIQFLDHIIVTKNDYISMEGAKVIDRDYKGNEMDIIDTGFLIEENERLKSQVEELQKQINNKLEEEELKNSETEEKGVYELNNNEDKDIVDEMFEL